MIRHHPQRGMTLVVALIMLIVLSLLVVSAIRFGNINLKITGNLQSETEAAAAAQVAIEKMVTTINASSNISAITNQNMTVSTGAISYQVAVTKPDCQFNKNIDNSQLDPTNAGDLVCFEAPQQERLITADETLTTVPTACKNQQWDVTAAINDNRSGVNLTALQGVSVRVGAEVACP